LLKGKKNSKTREVGAEKGQGVMLDRERTRKVSRIKRKFPQKDHLQNN